MLPGHQGVRILTQCGHRQSSIVMYNQGVKILITDLEKILIMDNCF